MPVLVRIMQKFLLSCEFTVWYIASLLMRLFILVMLIDICNAIYTETVLGQRLNLSGIYLGYNPGFFLVT